MKRLINGKLYDTENSELLSEHNKNSKGKPYRWESESLYRTKDYTYFWLVKFGTITNTADRRYVLQSGGCPSKHMKEHLWDIVVAEDNAAELHDLKDWCDEVLDSNLEKNHE